MTGNTPEANVGDNMTGNNTGREHDERRKAQAAAARKHRLRNRFNKATRKAWRKEDHDGRLQ